MKEIKCEICEKKLNGLKGLSQHVKVHGIKIKDYYDKYLKSEKEGECQTCSKDTTFRNITDGYNIFCSYKCSSNDIDINKKRGQSHRETLENNPKIISERIRKRALTFKNNPEIEIRRIDNISISRRDKFEKIQEISSTLPHFLYLIKHLTKPIIKIGRSENPEKRLKDIIRDFGDSSIINIIESSYDKICLTESYLHEHFREHCRVQPKGYGRTEWFDECILEEVIELIKENNTHVHPRDI